MADPYNPRWKTADFHQPLNSSTNVENSLYRLAGALLQRQPFLFRDTAGFLPLPFTWS